MAFLEIVPDYIVHCAKVLNFSKNELSQLNLAAEESIANIILNSLNDDPDETFTKICRKLPFTSGDNYPNTRGELP